ncbi:MAG: UvrD-helicase domain-containing protein [Porticoccaceae bacterium]|nr:UvrD-helicase domain-containing protein [Porticoccaceae bacterium]
MNQVSDLSQRQQALNPLQSFIVSAPAGSGKTGLITQRLLRLLCTVEHPEEILSITFTRKAAGEMASRIHSALHSAAYQPRPSDDYEAQTWDLAAQAVARSAELGWNLLEMPGRLRIQTIDGFCRYIASQFALETELGVLPEPSDNPQGLYELAARSLLDKIEQDSATARQLAVLLEHCGNDLARCERLLSDLLGKRDQWLPLIFNAADNQQYFQQVIDQVIGENLLHLQDALLPIAGELLELADFAAQYVNMEKNPGLTELAGILELPDSSLDGIAQWKLLLSLLVTRDHDIRKVLTKNEGFPSDQKEAKARMMGLLDWCRERPFINELIANSLCLPDAEINQAQQLLLDALGHLLPRLAAELEMVFKQQDQCDYTAITLTALEAIEPSPEDESISDITLRLDYQLRHILVDEFQDTSGSQIKLLEHLIAGWQPDDGRTLFLVGDAMQSLYGFRNANVGLFINAQRHPVGPVQCTPLTLSSNFRSQRGIIEWVNHAFSGAFPAQADISRGAIPYSPSEAFKGSGNGPAVHFQGFAGDDYDQSEAAHIASICSQLSISEPHQSIAILVRGRGHLKTIVPALRAANLSWQAIDITPLANRMPVVDMLSLTRALLSPADKIPWLAVLRAPFCGLSLGDLLVLTNSSSNSSRQGNAILEQLQSISASESFSSLSAAGQQILARVTPLLLDAWQNRGRKNLRDNLEQLWLALGGSNTLMASSDLDDIRAYLDLLEVWQVAGTVSDWNGFEQAVDKLYAAPAPQSGSQNSNIIQIMTIHKSKGLEFDHVLLPGLTRGSGSDKKPLLRWREHIDEYNQMSLIMAPLGAHDEEDDSVYKYLKHEDAVATRLENTRVLYVAATRAIRNLYLFANLKPTKKHGWQAPGKTTLLAPIWQTIEAGISDGSYSIDQSDTDKEAQPRVSLTSMRRLPSGYAAQLNNANAMLLGTEQTQAISAGDNDADLSLRARLLGTVMHRTLKQVANEGIDRWPAMRVQQLPTAWVAQLKELGILATDKELNALSDGLTAMLSDPRGQWILQSHPQAQCEQALGYHHRESNHAGTSVIDRTFVDQGIRWIIDYKFSKPAASETEQQFIARQSASYQAQLKHYAKLYLSLENNPVRCALYFPQMPLFIEVEAE